MLNEKPIFSKTRKILSLLLLLLFCFFFWIPVKKIIKPNEMKWNISQHEILFETLFHSQIINSKKKKSIKHFSLFKVKKNLKNKKSAKKHLFIQIII